MLTGSVNMSHSEPSGHGPIQHKKNQNMKNMNSPFPFFQWIISLVVFAPEGVVAAAPDKPRRSAGTAFDIYIPRRGPHPGGQPPGVRSLRRQSFQANLMCSQPFVVILRNHGDAFWQTGKSCWWLVGFC